MKKTFLTLASLFIIYSVSLANIADTYQDLTSLGVPMIVLILPSFWILLIPIILIEAYVFKHDLPDVPFHKIFWPITLVNLFSTIIAIPILWVLLTLLELILSIFINETFPSLSISWQLLIGVTIQAPWVLPFKNYLYWMIPTAAIWLLLQFFIISSWTEGLLLTKFNLPSDKSSIKKITWKANLASYSFLLLITLFTLFYLNFVNS